MAKTKYTVRFNGTVVDTRKSDRVYTHAVITWSNYEHDLAQASLPGDKTDRSNYQFYLDIAEGRREGSYYTTPEKALEFLRGAKSFEEYHEIRKAESVAAVEQRKAEGYYDKPGVLGYCGRLDLAQKLLSSRGSWSCYKDSIIVAVEVA